MLLVYVPTAHWVWGGAFMSAGGVFDYAGGTVVHINAGSAVAANASAGMAMAVTQITAATGALVWLLCEKLVGRKLSALGLVLGAVAGLVGITPAAGFADPKGALVIGIITAAGCYRASVILKRKLGTTYSLDAFGIHGFGGLIGAVLTSLAFNNQIFGSDTVIGKQVLIQLKDALTTIVYSGVMSFVI